MEFRPREVDKPKQPPVQTEPPFVYLESDGKEIRVPMEVFRTLPEEKKRDLFRLQMKGNTEDAKKKGQYPAAPAYAVTVVVDDCMPADMGKIAEVQKTCPAKMKLHEDYRLPVNTYIARYFVLNGDEKARIEEHWLSRVPSAKFSIELENGLSEVHRRSVVDGPDGERLETSPVGLPPNLPRNAQFFDPNEGMKGLAKPCANCGKNRYTAPVGPAGPVGAAK